MSFIVNALWPLVVPLLKLNHAEPLLPEGTALVRHLRPSGKWLTYQYLTAMFGMFTQFVGAVAGAIVLIAQGKAWSVGLAMVLLGIEFAVLGFTLVAIRVDYELRHYLVGDRSLRVSTGAWVRREVTLSYANVQNIEVRQGPLERWLGYKSVTVSTAGGASLSAQAEQLNEVTLAGLEDADAVRELILGMLKQQRDSGLGETTERVEHPATLPTERLREIRDAALALQAAAEARAQRQQHPAPPH